MIRFNLKKLIAVILAVSIVINISKDITYANTVALVVKAVKVNVRSGAGTNYRVLGQVSFGYSITSTGTAKDSSNKIWYKFKYNNNDGYIREDFVKNAVVYTSDPTFEQQLTNQGFSEDYKVLLRQLHQEYPNWVFKKVDTNLDFNEVVTNELNGTRSLIHASSISSYKSTDFDKYDWALSKWKTFDGGAWVGASKELVEYALDPRNSLFDPYIFQFEEQTFNPYYHTLLGVSTMVKGTFLDSAITTNTIVGNGTYTYNNPASNQGGQFNFPTIISATNNNQAPVSNINDSIYSNGPMSNNNVSSDLPINSQNSSSNVINQNSNNSSPTFSQSFGPNIAENSNNIVSETQANVNKTLPYDLTQNEAYSYENTGPGVINFNQLITPILENNKVDALVSALSNIIVAPGANVSSNIGDTSSNYSNVLPTNQKSSNTNSANSDEVVSYKFNFLPAGVHTYSEIIFDACKQVNVNPYVVVAMILQEQGKEGKSNSISGTNATYPNIYNYGNVGSYATNAVGTIENGLKYASTEGSYNRPWNSREKAIYGLVDYYANSFINKGQDTFYLKKWNVQGDNKYEHQYMTNVLGAISEGQILSSIYESSNIKNMAHEFNIICYNNLPSAPCPVPTKDGSPNNKLSSLTIQNCVLVPEFNPEINNYYTIVPDTLQSIKISATKFDNKAKISNIGNVGLTSGDNVINVNVTAENTDVRTYSILVYRQSSNITQQNTNNMNTIPIINNTNSFNNINYSGNVLSPAVAPGLN